MKLKSTVFFSICLAYMIMFVHSAVPHHHHATLEEALEHHSAENAHGHGHSHHYVHPDLENEQVLPGYASQPLSPDELLTQQDPFSLQVSASGKRHTGSKGDPPDYDCPIDPSSYRGPPAAGTV